jgi:FMN-dependent NADH-azoreductase
MRSVEGFAAKTAAIVATRDLAANDLPYVSAERFGVNFTLGAERRRKQTRLEGVLHVEHPALRSSAASAAI